MGRHRLATAMVAIAPAQPSLWDVPAAAAVVAVVPKPAKPAKPKSLPLRTAPLSLGGKRPDRDTRLVVTGEGEDTIGEQHYAWAGEMQCGRERHYALLVRYDARDEAMAPRRCVSVERVRVVVSE